MLEEESEVDPKRRLAAQLVSEHVARPGEAFPTTADAWEYALSLTELAAAAQDWCRGFPALEVVGQFHLPPPGVAQRDFQALHVDFGLPIVPDGCAPIARFTALYREPGQGGSDAATRIVPLCRVRQARGWQPAGHVLDRVARASPAESVEGVLARIIEAIDERADLPAQNDGCLRGMRPERRASSR